MRLGQALGERVERESGLGDTERLAVEPKVLPYRPGPACKDKFSLGLKSLHPAFDVVYLVGNGDDERLFVHLLYVGEILFLAILPIEMFFLTDCFYQLCNTLIKGDDDLFARGAGIFYRVMQKRGGDDIIVCPVLGDQEGYREKVGNIGQGFCLVAELPVMLTCRKLYRFLDLRRVVHML